MGEVELIPFSKELIIHSDFILYGNSATEVLCRLIAEEVEDMWNEPKAAVKISRESYSVRFRVRAWLQPQIQPQEIYYNTHPRNNYFRIEPFAADNISFVDAVGSNTGYFLLENLYQGSTTAAHEYGHTLGLYHPEDLDFRQRGRPGIMYPRGTLVEPQYQYDIYKPAGVTGGFMDPRFRKVLAADIELLGLHRLRFRNHLAVLGDMTNIYHDAEVKQN